MEDLKCTRTVLQWPPCLLIHNPINREAIQQTYDTNPADARGFNVFGLLSTMLANSGNSQQQKKGWPEVEGYRIRNQPPQASTEEGSGRRYVLAMCLTIELIGFFLEGGGINSSLRRGRSKFFKATQRERRKSSRWLYSRYPVSSKGNRTFFRGKPQGRSLL